MPNATVTDPQGRSKEEVALEVAGIMADRHAAYAAANPTDQEAKARATEAAATLKRLKGN